MPTREMEREDEGGLILDPFCGCGTTIHAAQKLNRQWIGIDVTHQDCIVDVTTERALNGL